MICQDYFDYTRCIPVYRMSSEKFSLRWNDFEANMGKAFKELREDQDFFDVTLAFEEEQIQAHKVVLAACSPFLRKLFKRNHHQHPLLYLKGVTYHNACSLLDFMYHGQVQIAEEELDLFLTIAEELQIKGLTQKKHSSPLSTNYSTPALIKEEKQARASTHPIVISGQTKKVKGSTSFNSFNQRHDDDNIQEIPQAIDITNVKIEQKYTATSSAIDLDQQDVTNIYPEEEDPTNFQDWSVDEEVEPGDGSIFDAAMVSDSLLHGGCLSFRESSIFICSSF